MFSYRKKVYVTHISKMLANKAFKVLKYEDFVMLTMVTFVLFTFPTQITKNHKNKIMMI